MLLSFSNVRPKIGFIEPPVIKKTCKFEPQENQINGEISKDSETEFNSDTISQQLYLRYIIL